MMASFHEFRNGMSVMTGNRCLATARPVMGHSYWMLKLDGASWMDKRARTPLRSDVPKNFQAAWKYPNLMLVKKKREARSILKALAKSPR